MFKKLGTFVLVVISLLISGCGYYLTARPPVMERKLGAPFNESVGALATAADYRMVYVKISPDAKLCAEAPPDAASQFASSFAASLSASPANRPLSAEAQTSLAVAMKQLFKRSQGVQFYRDGAFFLCNMYLNGAISSQQYLSELQALRVATTTLILEEIPVLEKITVDAIAVPTAPPLQSKESTIPPASGTEQKKIEGDGQL